MGKIISLANQKGGVGKTTTAVSLAAAMGDLNKKVLLVDLDPQGNATSGVGIDKRQLNGSVYDALVKGENSKNFVKKTAYKNLAVLPSHINLAAAELELIDIQKREYALKRSLSHIQDYFDYIFIDCPPSLGLLTTNALSASDSVIVPLQCEYYALEGLTQLINTIRLIKRRYNKYLAIEGILLTMYDKRLRLCQQVLREVKKYFPKQLFKTVIPRTVKLSEAPSFGEPIIYYEKNSKGAKSYVELAEEILIKNK
ncbi:MAG: AAA family ATPase [Clostridia bacterium]|nr:AAA family ATPase [Clostridia bacterium]